MRSVQLWVQIDKKVNANVESATVKSRRFDGMRLFRVGAGLALLLCPAIAGAEPPFAATERSIPVEQERHRVETALTLSHYAEDLRSMSLALGLRYGLLHDLEVGISVPYQRVEAGARRRTRIGDTLLHAKARLIRGREANPLSVAAQLQVKIPTAGEEALLGASGEADVGVFALASKSFSAVTTHVNFGYVARGDTSKGNKDNHLIYALGVEYRAEPTVVFFGELAGAVEVGRSTSSGPWSLGAGWVYQLNEAIALDISAGFGITHDAPDYAVRLGATYSPRP